MAVQENMVMNPGGTPVNFIPNRVVSIGTSASSTFPAGILYIATGGDIAVIPSGQTNSVLFGNLVGGNFIPVYINAVVARTGVDGLLICY